MASYPTYREPLTTYPNLQGYSQFGFGRRTCQGLPIVEQDLFLTMGGMAWALDIRKKRRADGTEVPVHWDNYTPLLIAKPVKFEFDAVVRDAEKMRAVTEMLGEDMLRDQPDLQRPSGKEDEFCINVRESPLLSPVEEGPKSHERRHGSDEAGRRSLQAEKSKVRAPSGLWPESLLVAQGPMIIQ